MLEHSRSARKQCWSTAGMRTGEMLEYTQKLLEYSRGVRRQVLEYSRDVHIDKYWNIVEVRANCTSNRNALLKHYKLLNIMEIHTNNTSNRKQNA